MHGEKVKRSVLFSSPLPPAEGSDFVSFSQTLTFSAGVTDATMDVTITTLEDVEKEDDETIICTLQDSPALPAVTPMNPFVATIFIQDDDSQSISCDV